MLSKAFMLTHKKYNKSARILATQLGLIPVSDFSRIENGLIAIRYGNAGGVFENDTKYNSPEVIRLCGDSLLFSEWCKENNINSPSYNLFSSFENMEFPFLLRQRKHIAGKDIIIVNSKDDIPPNFGNLYHVNYMKSDRELGIHFVAGKIVKIFEKVPFDSNAHPIIKSSCFGYHYKLIRDIENNFKSAQKLCIEIAQKLELGFGRFDVGYNSETKKYIIFEINTAPGLNPLTSSLYAELLRPVLNLDELISHEDNRTE